MVPLGKNQGIGSACMNYSMCRGFFLLGFFDGPDNIAANQDVRIWK
jgi:hypothetical protein